MRERRNEYRKELTYYLRAYENGESRLFGHVENISDHGVLIVGKRPYERGSVYRLSIALPEQKPGSKQFFVEALCKWSQEESTSEFFRSGFKTARPVGHLALAEAGARLSTVSLKRLFDVLASVFGMLVAAPLYLLVGLAIRIESKGPLFYSAERVGVYGRPFRMYKFRTMSATAGDDGPAVTAHDDPRITRLGRFLRQTKLNELPQLLNVLKGDMSFVGPRPEYAEFVTHYTPEQREVLSVKPGITGLATILYAGEEKMLKFSNVTETYLASILPDKLRLDLLYIRNRSLLLDVDILISTMLVLIPRFRKAAPRVEDILMGPLRVTRRHLPWFVTDAIIAFLSVSLAGVLWRSSAPLDVGLFHSLVAGLVMMVLFSVTNWLTGVQRVQWRYASPTEATDVIGSAFVATAAMVAANLLLPPPRFPTEMLIVAGILSMCGFIIARYHRRLLKGLHTRIEDLRSAAAVGQERLLVVGAGDAGQLTVLLFRSGLAGRELKVVGVVDDDINLLGTSVHRIQVLGVSDQIADIVRENDISTIVFAINNIETDRRHRLLEMCRATSARTLVLPDLLTSLLQGTQSAGSNSPVLSKSVNAIDRQSRVEWASEDLRNHIHSLAELARNDEFDSVRDALVRMDTDFLALESKGRSKTIAP